MTTTDIRLADKALAAFQALKTSGALKTARKGATGERVPTATLDDINGVWVPLHNISLRTSKPRKGRTETHEIVEVTIGNLSQPGTYFKLQQNVPTLRLLYETEDIRRAINTGHDDLLICFRHEVQEGKSRGRWAWDLNKVQEGE